MVCHRERAVVAGRAGSCSGLASDTSRGPLAKPRIGLVPVDTDKASCRPAGLQTMMIVTPCWYYSAGFCVSRGR